MQDLEQFAGQRDASLEAVASRHIGIREVGEFVTALEQEHSDIFVRWGLSRADEEGDYWILFTDDPGPEIRARAAELPADLRLVSGAAANGEELSVISGAIVSSLASNTDIYLSVATRTARYANAISVRYHLRGTSAASLADKDLAVLEAAALEAGARASVKGVLPFSVAFQRNSEAPPVNETVVQGGRDALWFDAHDWVPVCTFGFTAERGGDRGVITARHCADNLRYNSASNIDVVSLNPIDATPAANGIVDLQWHRTLTGNGHSTNKQFRATGIDPTDDRTVTSVANAPLDSVVCHWGFNTGYDCDWVESIDECLSLKSVTTCGLDVTRNDISEPGDSGGPWFYGSTARGIHTGAAQDLFSIFTRIGRVANNLNATVLEE